MMDFNDLAEQYVAVWNERDADRRRRRIEALWAPEGMECTKSRLVQGHQALYERVTASHERNVRDAGNIFRSCGNADGHHGLVRFNWTMNVDRTGAVVAAGAYILTLDDSGRICAAYFFSDPLSSRS